MNCKCFQITCKSFFPFTSNTHPYSNIAIHCLQSSRLPILQNEIIQITSFDTTSPSLSQTSFQLSIHLIHTITNRFNTLTKSSFLCLLYSLNKHFYRNGWHGMYEKRRNDLNRMRNEKEGNGRGNERKRVEWMENRNQGVNGVFLVRKYRNIHPYSL